MRRKTLRVLKLLALESMEWTSRNQNRKGGSSDSQKQGTKMFAGVYVENFLVQAIMRIEPELCGHALAVVEGVAPLVKVVALNEPARRAGIEIGMLKTTVTQFLGVEIRVRSFALEKSAHAAFLDLGWS